MRGHLEVVELLLSNGANVNDVDSRNTSSLYGASTNGHTEVLKLLLAKGATIDNASINFAKNTKTKEILDRWPQSMAILALQENNAYNLPNMSYLEDFNDFFGKKDGRGRSKKRKSKKRKSHKKRR